MAGIVSNAGWQYVFYMLMIANVLALLVRYYWLLFMTVGTAEAQWLRYCATNRKVAGSFPDGVIGIFH
jgi:hypothetical protein